MIKAVIFDYGGVVLAGINPLKGFYLYPEIIKFIKELKKKGIKTAILSNTIEPHSEKIKKQNGYKEFDIIILSCEVGLAKPDPEIYNLTLEKLKVKPEESIFIDDIKENLKPAKELGIKIVLAKNPEQVIKDVKNILKNER